MVQGKKTNVGKGKGRPGNTRKQKGIVSLLYCGEKTGKEDRKRQFESRKVSTQEENQIFPPLYCSKMKGRKRRA